MGMPEYHYQARTECGGSELDTADLRGRDDVAGDANDEQVPESLIEHDLRGHARIGAAEHDRPGSLHRRCGQLAPPGPCARVHARDTPSLELVDETAVAFAQRC